MLRNGWGAERVVAAINKALDGVPRDRVRLHVCWGNYEGPHGEDVPLREIFPILKTARVGGFVLPFANPRHAHEYRVLERSPLAADQTIVAGVVAQLVRRPVHERQRASGNPI